MDELYFEENPFTGTVDAYHCGLCVGNVDSWEDLEQLELDVEDLQART